MAGEVRQRYMQASYIKTGTEDISFELMGLGFSEVNESPSAQTSSKRYVNDKATTKRITGYDWTTAFTADQIRSEEAVKFICDIGELQKTGAEAETDYIIVDLAAERAAPAMQGSLKSRWKCQALTSMTVKWRYPATCFRLGI